MSPPRIRAMRRDDAGAVANLATQLGYPSSEVQLAERIAQVQGREEAAAMVAELQRIVAALEAGSVGLEESIALYREGLRIHAACEERLRAAELTISELGRRAGASARAVDAGETAPAEPGGG